MKNIAKSDRPKSATAILPPCLLRGSGKAAQTAFKPATRDGNSFIHMVNHFSGNLGIPKLAAATTFRTAAGNLLRLRGSRIMPRPRRRRSRCRRGLVYPDLPFDPPATPTPAGGRGRPRKAPGEPIDHRLTPTMRVAILAIVEDNK
jgi:hypothetical protein